MCLGILGEYIGHVFEETRNRPLYWLSDDSAAHENNPYYKTHSNGNPR